MSEEELRQNIQSLRDEKSRIFQEINENDVEGQMIQFKLRHIAENGENKKVENHLRELEQAAVLIQNITDKLEKLEFVIGSLSVKPTDIHRTEVLGKREYLINNLHRALKTEVNVKRNFSTISQILSKYLDKEEKVHFEQFVKKKIKLVLKLIATEKKIQYEINRYKILRQKAVEGGGRCLPDGDHWRQSCRKSTEFSQLWPKWFNLHKRSPRRS